MFVDYHVHSEFSDDSVYEMEQLVRDAIAMGIEELCFTDHVDYGVKWDFGEPMNLEIVNRRQSAPNAKSCLISRNVDYPAYYEKIQRMQREYGDKIRIKLGMEFGVQTHTIPRYKTLFAKYPFDFIILSFHQVDDKEFWSQDFQKGKTQKEYNDAYYEEMLRVVREYHDYSILGHMDMVVRYDKNGRYPFKNVRDIVEEILRIIIADGKGLEVNTSSKRYELDDLTPSRDILRLYRELGGEILTIGSDSHRPERLGDGVEEVKNDIRELGFTKYCTFDKMIPTFHTL